MTRAGGPDAGAEEVDRPVLLVIQHVAWEGPHRILDFCPGLDVRVVTPLEGEGLPSPDWGDGALVMGGPMNVDDLTAFPPLAEERRWLAEAVAVDLPILGVCPGAQLLAQALGVTVKPGAQGDRLREGRDARRLRRDPIGVLPPDRDTGVPLGERLGILFHPEADLALVEACR